MKFVIPCSVIYIFMLASFSFAGDYHNQNIRRPSSFQIGVTLACAQCHTMHGTQGGNSFSLIYTGSPLFTLNKKLIRAENVVKLCKHCHEGDPYGIGAPKIFGPTYNASAGDFNAGSGSFDWACNSATSTMTDGDKRHDIGCDLTSKPPPGFETIAGNSYNSLNAKDLTFWQNNVITRHGDGDGIFSCEFCHDQHGNTNYRNVRPTPYDPNDRVPGGTGVDGTYKAVVTYNNATYDGTSSILQTVIDGDADGSPPQGQFQTSNITFRSSTNQIAGFCGKCHINFYGNPGDVNLGGGASGDTTAAGDEWRRHPVGGINVGINLGANGHTDPDNVASITGTSRVRVINPDGADSGADEQPFCFTCHRVHGSTNHSNLIFGSPTSIGGAGTMIRDTCNQCHNQ